VKKWRVLVLMLLLALLWKALALGANVAILVFVKAVPLLSTSDNLLSKEEFLKG
jgi:hypothetical protein